MAALAILLTSGFPILFRQMRCGLNGRHFTLPKFRTMELGSEERLSEISHLNEMTGPVFKASKDPRLTLVGRILRRLSIDELPQLWNVIRGDMSLVGPRPPVPYEVKEYDIWHKDRLLTATDFGPDSLQEMTLTSTGNALWQNGYSDFLAGG